MAGDSKSKAANHRRLRRPALLWLGLAAAALCLLPTCGDTNEFDPGGQSDPEEINARWEVWAQAEEQWRTMESIEDLIIATRGVMVPAGTERSATRSLTLSGLSSFNRAEMANAEGVTRE